VTEINVTELRAKAEPRVLSYRTRDGDEIVYCGEQPDGYAGWTPREIADAKGYTPVVSNEAFLSFAVLSALLDAVEALRGIANVIDGEPHCSAPEWSEWEARFDEARSANWAALAPFKWEAVFR
jgi:hypothetical protein